MQNNDIRIGIILKNHTNLFYKMTMTFVSLKNLFFLHIMKIILYYNQNYFSKNPFRLWNFLKCFSLSYIFFEILKSSFKTGPCIRVCVCARARARARVCVCVCVCVYAPARVHACIISLICYNDATPKIKFSKERVWMSWTIEIL